MTKLKICGNTNADDVQFAMAKGVDFIGFIFAKSKRYIDPEKAFDIISAAPAFPGYVGVFANQTKQEVEQIAKHLKLKRLQFHGEETSRYCESFMAKGFRVIKTFHVKDAMSLKRLDEYNVSAFLFDTYSKNEKGGTGKAFDWSLIEAKPYVQDRLFLAGGLGIDNLRDAIRQLHPYAVDIASGVEKSPGVKDHELIRQVVEIVKNT